MSLQNIDHWIEKIHEAIGRIEWELREAREISSSPLSRLHPRLFKDGDQWCALYGEDLQAGVAGFGYSPYEAEQDFNRNYNRA